MVVKWKDAEHQKRAVLGVFLVFERMSSGRDGDVVVELNTKNMP